MSKLITLGVTIIMSTSAFATQLVEQTASFIAGNEGFRANCYQCVAGHDTIGYGFSSKELTSKGTITKDEADRILAKYSTNCLTTVDTLVKVPLTNNQKTVLADFIYQYGRTAFATSTLLKKINAGAPAEEIDFEIRRWKYVRDGKGGKVVSQGLVNRNERRVKLYHS